MLQKSKGFEEFRLDIQNIVMQNLKKNGEEVAVIIWRDTSSSELKVSVA